MVKQNKIDKINKPDNIDKFIKQVKADLDNATLNIQDIALWEVMNNSIYFTECFLPDTSRKKPLHVFYYQYPFYLMREGVFRCARFIGKTIAVKARAIQTAIVNPCISILITSYRKHHVQNITREIKLDIDERNDFLKYAKSPRGRGRSDLHFFLPLINDTEIWGLAGGDDGKNYEGKRYDVILEDETQFCNKKADDKLISTWRGERGDTGDFIDKDFLSLEIENKIKQNNGELSCLTKEERQQFNKAYIKAIEAKKAIRCWFGVPNGIRTTPLYQYEHGDNRFKNKIINIPRYYYPFFTLKDWNDAVAQFKGEDSDEFLQQILGEHGSPCHSVFNMNDIMRCIEYQQEDSDYFYYFRQFGIPKNKVANKEYISLFLDEIKPMRIPKDSKRVIIGMDVGKQPDPSIIKLFSEEYDNDFKQARYRLFGIIKLTDIEHHRQAELMYEVINKFNASLMAIDIGGAGVAVYDMLCDPNQYTSKHNCNILPISFGSAIVIKFLYLCIKDSCIGKNIQMSEKDNQLFCPQCGNNDLKFVKKQEVKRLIKEFSTDLIATRLDRLEYILPDDVKMLEEFNYYRYKTVERGKTYLGQDHYITAMRAFEMALYMTTNQVIELKQQEDTIDFICGTSEWEEYMYVTGQLNTYGYLIMDS